MAATERLRSDGSDPIPKDETLEVIMGLIQLLSNESKDAKTRYIEFTRRQDDLAPTVRALIKYCVDYEFKPGLHSEEIAINHDPLEVYERLTEFEQACADSSQVVLLAPSNNLGDSTRTAHLLEGKVTYTLNTTYNFWYITAENNPGIRLGVGNVHHAIRSPNEWEKGSSLFRELGHTPLIGLDTLEAYLTSSYVHDSDRDLVVDLLVSHELGKLK